MPLDVLLKQLLLLSQDQSFACKVSIIALGLASGATKFLLTGIGARVYRRISRLNLVFLDSSAGLMFLGGAAAAETSRRP
jgi:hypothetical protein